jgi:chromosome segregation ATPase
LQERAKKHETEIKTLSDKLMGRQDLVEELQEQLEDAQQKTSRVSSSELRQRDRQIKELLSQVKQLSEGHNVNDLSMQLSVRDKEAREMKRHLRRLREERTNANKKAEDVENELEALQTKYEDMLERLTSGKSSKDDIRAKETKGLIKEIIWLKARCRREERLRQDLAWSKTLLERKEAMRAEW